MILLYDKKTGRTSFDVIKSLKKHYQGQKIGHAGTLDPLATGLLLIGIGTDTKKLGDFSQYNKIYEATIDLSQQSDTRDSDYRQHHIHYAHNEHSITLNDQIIPAPSEQTIIKLCQSLIPCYDLPLPAFSAKKVKGKKLYDLARKGIDLQRVQTMNIHRIDLIEYKFPLIRLRCDVGSGTYIRSIAHRLGQQLKMGGILTALRRTHIGPYSVEGIGPEGMIVT